MTDSGAHSQGIRPMQALRTVAIPLAAFVVFALVFGRELSWSLVLLVSVTLVMSVVTAVHHAEVIAQRVGEPFGTLVLALAVTVIETSLIVSLMLSGGDAASALARDTVYATVMIICNGVVGVCLLLGAVRHRVIAFRVEGTTPSLSVLATLVTLTLILPSFTTSSAGPTLSTSQLVFAAIVSLTLYGIFIFVQTVRHRDYFLPVGRPEESHGPTPSSAAAGGSLALLVVCLLAVVGLSKVLAPGIEAAVLEAGIPHAVVGVAFALMVLLPETWAAIRAATGNRMQTSFNLALGSALATIGLTIPAVVATSLALGMPLVLGLPNKDIVLLALTLLISTMTLSRGRATVLQGSVHTVLFVVFLFLTAFP